MTRLLVKAGLVLAAAELAVMFALPLTGMAAHPIGYLLDPLLMLAVALGPLYLLLRGDLARLEKNKRLDAKLHTIVNDLWSVSLHTVSTDVLLDSILREILDSPPISIQSRGAIFLTEGGELRLKSSRGFTDEHKQVCGSVPAGERRDRLRRQSRRQARQSPARGRRPRPLLPARQVRRAGSRRPDRLSRGRQPQGPGRRALPGLGLRHHRPHPRGQKNGALAVPDAEDGGAQPLRRRHLARLQ
jgi:hypothetical protein